MNNKVQALDNLSPRALETYTKHTVIGCGEIGYTEVTLYITHNMTTGKSWISSISHDDTVFVLYPLADITSVETDPDIDEYFTGKISIKITVHYSNIGHDFQTIKYINSWRLAFFIFLLITIINYWFYYTYK